LVTPAQPHARLSWQRCKVATPPRSQQRDRSRNVPDRADGHHRKNP
jgi:hypothetical protein